MNKLLLLLVTFTVFTSCDIFRKSLEYKEVSEEFVESLLAENYDRCLELFDAKSNLSDSASAETLRPRLEEFRDVFINNFGSDLDYSFMRSRTTWSSVEKEGTAPDTTIVLIQFSNDTHFGVISLEFDDESGKIMQISIEDVKEPIPNMLIFWLLGIVFISVPVFNLYVIRLIWKSNQKRKPLKYLAVIALNIPGITYAAVGGLSISILSFQMLLGFSFDLTGYLNTAWTIGIPLGGLYWFWKLKREGRREIEE